MTLNTWVKAMNMNTSPAGHAWLLLTVGMPRNTLFLY